MTLSIVIPAYNEADRLPNTLSSIARFFATRSDLLEVVIVDDGSTDHTAEIAKQHFSEARIIRHPQNLGKGAAVRTGMLAARGEWRYLCDADLSTPITDIDLFLAKRDQADVIIGSRRMSGANVMRSQAWWKVWLGRLGNIAIQLLATPGIQDSQCGFKLFAASTMLIFSQQRIQRWGYDFELLFLARHHGFQISEIPVTWVNDERSKVKPFDYIRTLGELLQIRWNALRGLYPLMNV